MIETKDLKDFQELPAGRQKLVESAIAVAKNWPWLPYIYGGADPASGGLDCSGAMYYVMTRVGLTPPRTAAGQYSGSAITSGFASFRMKPPPPNIRVWRG